jgi:alpha-ribazole phosphatase
MTPTRFWLLRHAIVSENARAVLYGTMDVDLCEDSLVHQIPTYQSLARRLPRNAKWLVTPLSRTRRTAEAIQAAGYPATPLITEPGLIEQHLGDWQGLPHEDLPHRLQSPAHAFWPLGAGEIPPNGESMSHVVDRVGATLDRLAITYAGQDIIAVSHGGAIRAALAHAIGADAATVLHFSVQNLSLTVLERLSTGWRVVCVNEMREGSSASLTI